VEAAKPFRILAVCGSLQTESSHLLFLQRLRDLKVTGLEIHLSDHLRHLPLFNPDLMSGESGNPNKLEPVESWRQALADCHGIIIASPEYGHSLSGVLKNGIDWVIGSGELYRKTVAITTVVKHPERGVRAGLQDSRGSIA
jgi:chromate reductase, NAD(P)H dehydrogenase (quinone)